MKALLKIILLALFFGKTIQSFGQTTVIDTIKVMSYNVLNYGDSKKSCPLQTPAKKNPYLRTIIKYVNPDIIGMVKMVPSNSTFLTKGVLTQIFDSVCSGCYSSSTPTNKSGYNKNNMLYYRKDKFGLKSSTTLYSADNQISDINLYTLYYKSKNLATTNDTIFLNIILVHDLSGSTAQTDRTTELTGTMTALKKLINQPENIIIMGDFNVTSSTEGCYQAMIAEKDTNVKFNDLANQIGDWSKYPSKYTKYLTQACRTVDPGDCGSVGGLDSRFDHILGTSTILKGTKNITYLDSTFNVVGNDGLHYNKAITDAPTNKSVPSNVLTALYNMASHLPITINLTIAEKVTSLNDRQQLRLKNIRFSVNENKLNIFPTEDQVSDLKKITLQIFDLSGRLVLTQKLDLTTTNSIELGQVSKGMYLFNISSFKGNIIYSNKFIKN